MQPLPPLTTIVISLPLLVSHPPYTTSTPGASSPDMDTESSHAQEHDFAQTSWLDIGGFSPSEQSPTLDYQAFGYGVVPLDPSYGVDIPPPYETLPIAMPPPPSSWPSMLSNQGPFPEPGMPAVPLMQAPPTLAPVPTIPAIPRKASTSKASTGKSSTGKSSTGKSSSGKSNSNPTPRRTLTDEDRRRMCLYHEENKTAKQTDIGGKAFSDPTEGRFFRLISAICSIIRCREKV